MKTLLHSLVGLTLAFGSSIAPTPALAFKTEPPPEKTWLLQDEKNTIDIFNKAADSVVFVETRRQMREDFFSQVTREVPIGAGSGFIWDAQGHIVTNFHVIQASRGKGIFVRLRDGRTTPARLVGVDPRHDVALLKLAEVKDLPVGFELLTADSSQLQVGQKTVAIGNPFELNHTLTTGVVSAVNRTVPSPVDNISNRDMIQTDASINPGNSGGPLMDSRGQLIGMNSVIYSQSGSSAGVGFAVPSNTIKRIVTQIIKTGKVTYAGLGIAALPQQYNQYLNNVKGVIILKVTGGTGAAKAGLRGSKLTANGDVDFGDVITSVDGKKIEVLDDILSALDAKTVGEKVTVEYLRKGKKESTKVTLSNLAE